MVTSVAGPLYLATVMGVLIGRYTSEVNGQQAAAKQPPTQHLEPGDPSAGEPKP